MRCGHDKLAARLREAYANGPVPPLRDALDPQDVDAAYAVQAINTRFWTAEGRRVVGRKIGLTSEAVQRQLGVDRPDFGVLFDDMQLTDGSTLPAARTIQPKVEAEVALLLSRGIDKPDASPDDVAAAVGHVVAALEIVDSRIAEWRITFADTVADNGSSAFFVLGRERHRLGDLDLARCRMDMRVDGEVASSGTGAACLGHPLNAAAWLARTLATRGEPLRAGDVVLTGALGPMVALRPGMAVSAAIEGLGTVRFDYGKEQ
ncbi:2-keto-4-pentenoate hydratase [Sphingomonas adhaesiva]|uniref:2-keto-4-pentenoate hydratase n=1 Tax=Sphingomonas adhaesiva TaxID=28212 RepID=A0A2A4I5P4_9SPHN|nr:fumarylacetoacetate hydrolase family protein [Sphingomonas adhaesiva]PCG13113.1 2-keto-4-pentenoate hydratase [Sphingomonas adhaesiva]